jgi:L-lactate dehydrogenase complex protein LldG
MSDPMIEAVRRALGRKRPLPSPPTPPSIPDAVARLVARDADLVDVFAKSADAAHFHLERVASSDLCPRLTEFLREKQCKNVGMTVSPLLERLGIQKAIEDAGITVHRWDRSTLDFAYDLDCGITDVYAAVAETGSLVIQPTPDHGRAISLIPPMHIAIVEPANIVADLIDLFAKTAPSHPAMTLITGPSKTADIEGALVTGVHGPGIVQIFLLRD